MEPRKRTTRARGPLRRVLYCLAAVVVIIGIYAAYQGFGIYRALDNFSKEEHEGSDGVEYVNEKPPEWTGSERVNILLLGADARDGSNGAHARSDAMIVVSIDPVTKKAHLFSVLRDTYIDIPDKGKNRANTAVTLGGPNLAMKAIGSFLGLDIQYYVYADFEGFKALVDAIGGVEFEVEKNMRYTDNADLNRYDIDLKQGLQHLDGDKALQYVRFRHDAMSDFTRTERQRNFMKAVANKALSTWNIIRMKDILESVEPYIQTNLQLQDMWKLANLGLKSHVAGSAQIPPMELVKEQRVGGAEVLGVRDQQKLLEYILEVLAKDDTVLEAEPAEEDEGTDKGAAEGQQ